MSQMNSDSGLSTPRKRRRLESVAPSRVRRSDLQGRYNDAYRLLFNADVGHAAARFETNTEGHEYYATQRGASTWSAREHAVFFAALARLGRDDTPGIAGAIGTKSIVEVQELLLLLHDAATKQGDTKVTLREIPAAIELSPACSEQLDLAGEALAWHQEGFEAAQEQKKFGDYWLITPEIADQFEDAFGRHDRLSRAVSSPSASELEIAPLEGGEGNKAAIGVCIPCSQAKRRCDRGHPCGHCRRRRPSICVYKQAEITSKACVSCKQFKQRCDRRNPCGNCVRRKVTPCTYTIVSTQPDAPEHNDDAPGPLHPVPEANLLKISTMLMLSKTLFMNRSPTTPSLWPHWSEHTSEIAKEPAMYRTALIDFHTLVLSVTKRLVQTAIIQATSRLRSQRRRSRNGVLPFVKRRDVLSAIDIVGMKRNGIERWRGVARRCALKVLVQSNKGSQRGIPQEVPWDEVEQLMGSVEPAMASQMTDTEASDNDRSVFKTKARRSGTPLPIEQIDLSDSEGLDLDGGPDDPITDSSEGSANGPHGPFEHRPNQAKDLPGRYASIPPIKAAEDAECNLYTLEQFDQEASRLEEQILWEMLGLEPPAVTEGMEPNHDDEDLDLVTSEKVVTNPDNWRSWTTYHAAWEEYDVAVPSVNFTADPKSNAHSSNAQMDQSCITYSDSDDENGALSTVDQVRKRRTASRGVELRLQDPRAYAALQGRVIETTEHVEDDRSSSEDHDGSTGLHNVMQSVERDHHLLRGGSEEETDGDAYIE